MQQIIFFIHSHYFPKFHAVIVWEESSLTQDKNSLHRCFKKFLWALNSCYKNIKTSVATNFQICLQWQCWGFFYTLIKHQWIISLDPMLLNCLWSAAGKPGLPPHAPFTSPRCCTSRRRMLTGQWGRQADPHRHDYDIYSSLWRRPDAAAVGLPGYGGAQGTSPGQFYCITADGDKSNLTASPGGKALDFCPSSVSREPGTSCVFTTLRDTLINL